ncbi:MAG: hypothetical protein Ct9H300mP1_24390 [Planctomycetaceae bacterium]|nr:MAG: hypothetical protein Ct9H300mP1_24390 [Planctomycetaceae bacterium]
MDKLKPVLTHKFWILFVSPGGFRSSDGVAGRAMLMKPTSPASRSLMGL